MNKIDPNGDNYIFFVFEAIPQEVRIETQNITYSVNFYPMFEDLLEEGFV